MSTEQSPASSAGDNKWWLACSAVLFFALFIRSVFNFSWPINHDCAMYVAAGQLLLQGKVPYVDFIDLNPPLIFYVSAIPALFSNFTGIDVDKCFAIFVWALGLISWLFVYAACRHFKGRDSRYVGVILFALAAYNFLVGEWGEFGQRQHLAAIAIVPFLILRWLRSQGENPGPLISFSTGAFFALGLELVPQYALIPLAFECTLHGRKISLQMFSWSKVLAPEILACIICGIAYGFLYLLLPHAATDAFAHRWMPLTVRGYAAYNASWDAFTLFPFLIGCVPLFLIGAFIARKYRCSLTLPLFVVCISAYIAALVQLKGWYNHYLPMFAGSILFACVELEALLSTRSFAKSPLIKVSLMAAMLAVCTAPSILLRLSFTYPQGELNTLKHETKPGDKVMVLSTSVADAYPPLLLAKCVNGSRYLFEFPIEMLRFEERAGKTPEARAQAIKEQRDVIGEIEEDIRHSNPVLILIPAGKTPVERENSMVKYFQKVGLLDKLKAQFTSIGETEGRKTVFEVFKRNRS